MDTFFRTNAFLGFVLLVSLATPADLSDGAEQESGGGAGQEDTAARRRLEGRETV